MFGFKKKKEPYQYQPYFEVQIKHTFRYVQGHATSILSDWVRIDEEMDYEQLYEHLKTIDTLFEPAKYMGRELEFSYDTKYRDYEDTHAIDLSGYGSQSKVTILTRYLCEHVCKVFVMRDTEPKYRGEGYYGPYQELHEYTLGACNRMMKIGKQQLAEKQNDKD